MPALAEPSSSPEGPASESRRGRNARVPEGALLFARNDGDSASVESTLADISNRKQHSIEIIEAVRKVIGVDRQPKPMQPAAA